MTLDDLVSWLSLDVARGASMLALYILLFLVAKYVKWLVTPYDINQELTQDDNAAEALSQAGYYIGFTIVFCGAYLGPSFGWWQDLLLVGGYTLLGLLLLNLSRKINGRFLLYGMSVVKHLRDNHNPAAGVVMGGNYIAAALVVAGAINGEGGGLVTTLVFYVLGQLALLVFGRFYDWLTPYRIQDEIEKGNLAAGIGFAGSLIAIGVVVMAGTAGNFVSWAYNLGWLAVDICGVFVYLFLVRAFFDKVVLPGADLNAEIARDANVGAGVLEMSFAISFAVVLFFLMG